MATRRWSDWIPRAKEHVTATSSSVGLAGLGLAALGAVVSGPVIAGAGGLVLGGVLIYSAFRGFPPKFPHPQEFLGQTITDLNQVRDMQPVLTKVGFVGMARAGKSTLLDCVRDKTPSNVVTDKLYGAVIAVNQNPPKYVLLIDAAGQDISQQFKIVENTDLLVIILDHNAGDKEPELDRSRLDDQAYFLDQIGNHIQNEGINLKEVYFLLNKKDLWEQSASAPRLKYWFREQINRWGNRRAASPREREHCNLRALDITAIK